MVNGGSNKLLPVVPSFSDSRNIYSVAGKQQIKRARFINRRALKNTLHSVFRR
jgi:hypothetical protein